MHVVDFSSSVCVLLENGLAAILFSRAELFCAILVEGIMGDISVKLF